MIKRYQKCITLWKVRSSEEYFNLPRRTRQKFGWYFRPGALPFGDWDVWTSRIRREYPIQGFMREWLFDYENPVYAKIEDALRCIRKYYRYSQRFLNPDIPRARKTIPRHWRINIGDTLQDFTFALILDYVYSENFKHIMTDQDPAIRTFKIFISKAAAYIRVGRRHIEEDIEALWEERKFIANEKSFDETFEKIQELERHKLEQDTAILTDCMKYRHMFN